MSFWVGGCTVTLVFVLAWLASRPPVPRPPLRSPAPRPARTSTASATASVVSLRQVWTAARRIQRDVSLTLGADISIAPKTSRVQDSAGAVLGAVVIKLMLDKGIITAADLNAAVAAARSEQWPEEPND